ncbi:intracellular protein transport protein USO1-like [Aricia agestis]|uniref:intracellular protein transport protein USO1-like n=1 Tax=Aricia agestis TaxID=91739 RepID=UPI001C20A07C|nr:intracellular protein transport protein USO1-like [Aricia agestis]
MSKNTNSVKSTKSESPKTPGGISISLLTPCRRVGLSRSWRKEGPSPFISPLSSSQQNTVEEQSTPQARNSRKRKNGSPEKGSHKIEDENDTSATNTTETENSQTPTRANVIRKRSKTLLSKVTQNKCESPKETKECNDDCEELNATKVSKLSRLNSKFNKSKSPLIKIDKENKSKQVSSTPSTSKLEGNLDKTKNTSPQNLTTECVVVIQKEIFKDNSQKVNVLEKDPKPSQILLDSDSDDIPLCQINKNTRDVSDEIEVQSIAEEISDERGTIINDAKIGNKVSKLEDKKTSTTDLKTIAKKSKLSRKSSKTEIKIESKPSSQSSFDDEDDDDFDHRKTIIVKKCYDKVVKPLKAKSTGSITDKDIEELKTRIEVKKKLLLAKTLDSDTKDVRDLIKKWQKGCQDALVELMELMKKKMPDQPKMENAQILNMLKIPADLVGYDSENDCFNSPNDTNIILSCLKI